MPKQRTYTMPVSVRLSAGMMEYVDYQARQEGVAVVDWIRQAIAFMYWERDWVRGKITEAKERPINYLAEFETMCQELDDPKSQLSREQEHRREVVRRKGLPP